MKTLRVSHMLCSFFEPRHPLESVRREETALYTRVHRYMDWDSTYTPPYVP